MIKVLPLQKFPCKTDFKQVPSTHFVHSTTLNKLCLQYLGNINVSSFFNLFPLSCITTRFEFNHLQQLSHTISIVSYLSQDWSFICIHINTGMDNNKRLSVVMDTCLCLQPVLSSNFIDNWSVFTLFADLNIIMFIKPHVNTAKV